MEQNKELGSIAKELCKCGELLIDISKKLNGHKTSEDDMLTPVKELRLEDVRAVLAEKSRNGFTKDIKEILNKYGVSKLSEIDKKDYSKLLSEVEVIGNAG